MYFDEFDFEDEVLDALDSMNFIKCTPIQEQTLEPLMAGRDLIGVAQTGTGKTAAYLLPVLNRLCRGEYPEDAINCIKINPLQDLGCQLQKNWSNYTKEKLETIQVSAECQNLRVEILGKSGKITGLSVL